MENTVYLILNIARQIDGEYVFVRPERAFVKKEMADELLQLLKSQSLKDGVQIPVNLMTPHGEVQCYMEVGVFEIKVE